jgi:hypothetical protein
VLQTWSEGLGTSDIAMGIVSGHAGCTGTAAGRDIEERVTKAVVEVAGDRMASAIDRMLNRAVQSSCGSIGICDFESR